MDSFLMILLILVLVLILLQFIRFTLILFYRFKFTSGFCVGCFKSGSPDKGCPYYRYFLNNALTGVSGRYTDELSEENWRYLRARSLCRQPFTDRLRELNIKLDEKLKSFCSLDKKEEEE